jgi:hypothetical protein
MSRIDVYAKKIRHLRWCFRRAFGCWLRHTSVLADATNLGLTADDSFGILPQNRPPKIV